MATWTPEDYDAWAYLVGRAERTIAGEDRGRGGLDAGVRKTLRARFPTVNPTEMRELNEFRRVAEQYVGGDAMHRAANTAALQRLTTRARAIIDPKDPPPPVAAAGQMRLPYKDD